MDLLLLTSPPASGKTHWIETFFSEYGEDLIIISPLRALADECLEKWSRRIPVLTPEEWLLKRLNSKVVIFDEFHLNFYWGDTFRPALWEAFFELCYSAELVVLLTATMSSAMIETVERFEHFDSKFWCDLGNQKLKNCPLEYIAAPSKRWVSSLIDLDLAPSGVKLIFCQYRDEVRRLGDELTRKGKQVWTCVGGEAQGMRILMKSGVRPDYIISTTVLSHGVNLPPLSAVIFLYPVKNPDFWIQMVARGGRRGEDYVVFALEKPCGMKFNRVTNAIRVLGLTLRMRVASFLASGAQWFLKE